MGGGDEEWSLFPAEWVALQRCCLDPHWCFLDVQREGVVWHNLTSHSVYSI